MVYASIKAGEHGKHVVHYGDGYTKEFDDYGEAYTHASRLNQAWDAGRVSVIAKFVSATFKGKQLRKVLKAAGFDTSDM